MDKKEEIFKKTVDENKVRILRICRYYAPSIEDQKDMYQEILINIWKSLENFRGDSEIGTWIYRIAINTSLSFAGKQYKSMKLNVDFDSCAYLNLLKDDDNMVQIKEEKFNALQTELNQLSVIDKALMGLVIEGLSTKEIADIIGITEPNVRVKIHRVKEMLQDKMKGGNYEK
jgi:RNA polymerase sigma-70 factor, ECF subfamily